MSERNTDVHEISPRRYSSVERSRSGATLPHLRGFESREGHCFSSFSLVEGQKKSYFSYHAAALEFGKNSLRKISILVTPSVRQMQN